MTIFYGESRVDKLGGLSAFSEKLLQQFGPTDSDSPGWQVNQAGDKTFVVKWTFPEQQRLVAFTNAGSLNAVAVWDSSKQTVLSKRRGSKADLGF